jgi:hypothetical protein
MSDDNRNEPLPGNPAEHWGTRNPEDQPPRDQIMGLPRLVTETCTRLGPNTTAEDVVCDLRSRGIDTTEEEVRRVWDPHLPSPP